MITLAKKPLFKQGDLAVLKLNSEKVTILKKVEPDDPRNRDLGNCYLIRSFDDKLKTRYEFELAPHTAESEIK